MLADKNDAAETWHNIIVADNSASGVDTLAGIGFNAQGWTNDIAKAGIFQKREGSYGRGSLFFVNNNDSSWTSATESDAAITIDPDGNVGIGSANPQALLDVNSSTTDQVARFKSTDADAFISIEDNYDSVYIGHSSGDNVMSLGFSSTMGSTSNLTINPLGNVGIGTNVPDSSVPLTILGPSAGRFMTLDAPTDGAYMTFETATTAYADIGSEKAITAAGAVDDPSY